MDIEKQEYWEEKQEQMASPIQESFENFENLKFDAFESKDVLLDDWNDPNKNFL